VKPGDWVRWPAEIAQRYRELGYWQGISLAQATKDWCVQHAHRIALCAGDREWTYRELDEWADQLADGLRASGIKPGERIVVQLPNVPEFVAVMFAAFRIGVLPVLALPAHRRAEIEHLVTTAEPTAYVVAGQAGGFDYRELAREVADTFPGLRVLVASELAPLTGTSTIRPPIAADQVAFFLLSGGSTGLPKLIPRTHDDYLLNIRVSSKQAGLTEESVFLTTLPIAHNFGLGCPGVFGTLSMGGKVVLFDSGIPARAFELIERHRVTIAALVPPLARLWVGAAGSTGFDLSSLDLVQVGGQRLGNDVARQFAPALGCRLQQSFGMAEGMLIQTSADDPEDLVCTTQGRPISPGDEARVVDEDEQDVPDGELGQLLARGPYTIRGYYKASEHNAKAFTADGFYRTGDLVRRLSSGHLVVEGRLTDVINRGGNKISPDEVEHHLRAHPGVADAVVLSVPDEFMGERTCVVVVPTADPVSLPELTAHLRACGVAEYKWPDRLTTMAALPTTAVGKISRAELRQRLLADRS
jgi:2,3-dihydroxybenzoate-AMP ligase